MTLFMMCGAPASGKSWFAINHMMYDSSWRYISRDEIRFKMLKDDEDYFAHETEVFNTFVKEIKDAIQDVDILYVIADATHLSWASRSKLLRAIGEYIYSSIDIIPVVVNCDIQTIIKRNSEREGRAKVPQSALKNMIRAQTDPNTDPFDYTAIMYVKNGQNDLVEKPQFMYHKNDIKMKEIPLKNLLRR